MTQEAGQPLPYQERKRIYTVIAILSVICAVMVTFSLIDGADPRGTPEQIRQNAQAQQYGIPALIALFVALTSVFLWKHLVGLRVCLVLVAGLMFAAIVLLYVH